MQPCGRAMPFSSEKGLATFWTWLGKFAQTVGWSALVEPYPWVPCFGQWLSVTLNVSLDLEHDVTLVCCCGMLPLLPFLYRICAGADEYQPVSYSPASPTSCTHNIHSQCVSFGFQQAHERRLLQSCLSHEDPKLITSEAEENEHIWAPLCQQDWTISTIQRFATCTACTVLYLAGEAEMLYSAIWKSAVLWSTLEQSASSHCVVGLMRSSCNLKEQSKDLLEMPWNALDFLCFEVVALLVLDVTGCCCLDVSYLYGLPNSGLLWNCRGLADLTWIASS